MQLHPMSHSGARPAAVTGGERDWTGVKGGVGVLPSVTEPFCLCLFRQVGPGDLLSHNNSLFRVTSRRQCSANTASNPHYSKWSRLFTCLLQGGEFIPGSCSVPSALGRDQHPPGS